MSGNFSSISLQFEKAVTLLLTKLGYRVGNPDENQPKDQGLDLFIFDHDDVQIAVEIKLYRSRSVSAGTLRNAASALLNAAVTAKCERAIFIASVRERALEVDKMIQFWGTETLRTKASEAGLTDLFEEFFRDPIEPSLDAILESLRFEENDSANLVSRITGPARAETPRSVSIGRQCVDLLRVTSAGRADALLFENRCTDALKYLFDSEFASWRPQHRVEDGFQISDLVARLVPQHDFWLHLSHDFNSRYVIFEFKNYESEISQNQIYTTEKYLYAGGLRKIAIIIARNGVSINAQRAIKAALREHGKLVAWLTLDELSFMLSEKDQGNEFYDTIINRADEILGDLAP